MLSNLDWTGTISYSGVESGGVAAPVPISAHSGLYSDTITDTWENSATTTNTFTVSSAGLDVRVIWYLD